MIDLKLVDDKEDVNDHDLYYENYDLGLVDEIDQIRQNLGIRLQFFYNEWFLDTSKGIKFYDIVFVKVPDLNLIASVMKTFILSTEGVLELLEYSQIYDRRLRKLTVSCKVNTTFGETENTSTIGV